MKFHTLVINFYVVIMLLSSSLNAQIDPNNAYHNTGWQVPKTGGGFNYFSTASAGCAEYVKFRESIDYANAPHCRMAFSHAAEAQFANSPKLMYCWVSSWCDPDEKPEPGPLIKILRAECSSISSNGGCVNNPQNLLPCNINNSCNSQCNRVGNPINIAIGMKIESEVDFESFGFPNSLKVQRTYEHRPTYQINDRTVRAYGEWHFHNGLQSITRSFEVATPLGTWHDINENDCAAHNMPPGCKDHWDIIHSVDYEIIRIKRPDSQTWEFRNALIMGQVNIVFFNARLPFVKLERTFSPEENVFDGWKLSLRNKGYERYDADGRVVEFKEDATAITKYVTYSTDSETGLQLVTVSQADREISYRLDRYSRIESFIDPHGKEYNYDYKTDGGQFGHLLSAIRYPDGTQLKYNYDHPTLAFALTSKYHVDVNGNELLLTEWNYDSLGRAISSEKANGQEKVILEFNSGDVLGTTQVTVTNPLNKKTTYHLADIGSGNRITEVQGHQSDNCAAASKFNSYYNNGTLQTQTDWNGNVVFYERDSIGREVKRTTGLRWQDTILTGVNVDTSELVATSETVVIETCWSNTVNQPSKIIQGNRVSEFFYDDAGRLEKHTQSKLGNQSCN